MWLAAAMIALLAGAPARNIDLPRLLAGEIAAAKARTLVPILVPEALPSTFRHHYADGTASASGWRFDIGAVRDCNGANVCFIAQLRGRHGGRPSGRRTLALARGRTGHFRPLSCGASCSPPSIEWRERRTLYTIQAKVGTRDSERRLLVRMANSAIRHGPR